MDRSEVISLVSTTHQQNEYGVFEEVTTSKDVFCQVDSITRAEFFDAGRNGLNPAFRFTMFAGDYDGERVVIYNGKSYAVYRTYYARTDVIELYVERKGGTNGKESTG